MLGAIQGLRSIQGQLIYEDGLEMRNGVMIYIICHVLHMCVTFFNICTMSIQYEITCIRILSNR